MEDKDIERKIALLHAAAGVVLGIFSGIYVGGTNYNLVNVIVLGIVVSYPLMLLTKKIYWPEMQFKDWLGKGFYIFFVFWIVVWIFLFNI